MKLNQLQDMVAIVEHGSLRAAARHLDVPQPQLTRSLRTLEREMGVALFECETRGMTLTPIGRLFHQRASAIVQEVRRAHDEIRQSQGENAGTVIAGLSIMPHVGLLPQALHAFRARFPKVRLQLIEGLFPDLEARLRNGTVDFYLGAAPHEPPAPGLVSQTLFENLRAVVCRRGHPLAGLTSLKALSEADADWATPSIDYKAETDLNQVFARHRLPPPRVVMQAGSALSLMVGLAHSDMLAMLPVQWGDFPLVRDMLQVIPLKEKIPAPPMVLIRRPDLPLTPAAEHLCGTMLRGVPEAMRHPLKRTSRKKG